MMKEDAHNSPQTDAETKNIHISGRKTAARPMPELHPEPDDAILIRTPDNRRLSTIFSISGTTPFCSPPEKFRRQRENTALSAFSDLKRFTGSTRNRYIHRRTRRPAADLPESHPFIHSPGRNHQFVRGHDDSVDAIPGNPVDGLLKLPDAVSLPLISRGNAVMPDYRIFRLLPRVPRSKPDGPAVESRDKSVPVGNLRAVAEEAVELPPVASPVPCAPAIE